METTFLRLYTNLASIIHLLATRKITFLDPSKWDDENDIFSMNEYQKRKNAKSVLALCFAASSETYQHWRTFSHGPDGVCIEFSKECLLEAFNGDDCIKHRSVKYIRIRDPDRQEITVEDLPYCKRWPYRGEEEYRAVYLSTQESKEYHNVSINLDWIKRITLSPWLATPLVKPVKKVLKSIEGCSKLKISHSSMRENQEWKSFVEDARI